MINIAIIGLQEGLSALHAATRLPEWNVHTLCDLDQSLLEKRKKEYDLDSYLTNDYTALLDDSDIDLVAIFTPDHLHAEHAISALEAGKHVILTKPIAADIESAKAIKAACLRYPNQIFFAAHTSRFIPSLMDQYADYCDGKLGKLISIETSYNADKRQRAVYLAENWEAFSPLHIWLVHPIDIALWYLKDVETFSLATAQSASFKKLALSHPDSYVATLANAEQTLGLVKGFYSSPEPPVVQCILRGESGYSKSTYPNMSYKAAFDERPPIENSYQELQNDYFPFAGHSHHVGEMQAILLEASHCIERKAQPSCGIDEGLLAVRLLELLQKAKPAQSRGPGMARNVQ